MTEDKIKILIVDDDEAIGQTLKAGLEMHGFAARYETRSIDTIKACLEFHPDLVLLDVDMPVKDGGVVAAELRSHPTLQHIPVIFLTSLMTKEQDGKRNAFRGIYLSKPIPIAELVVRIRAVLQSQTPGGTAGALPPSQTGDNGIRLKQPLKNKRENPRTINTLRLS